MCTVITNKPNPEHHPRIGTHTQMYVCTHKPHECAQYTAEHPQQTPRVSVLLTQLLQALTAIPAAVVSLPTPSQRDRPVGSEHSFPTLIIPSLIPPIITSLKTAVFSIFEFSVELFLPFKFHKSKAFSFFSWIV